MPRKRRTYLEKFQAEEAARQAIRSDVTQTEARYDEIVSLRMLLLDILDGLDSAEDEGLTRHYTATFRERIKKRTPTWGKKDDCV